MAKKVIATLKTGKNDGRSYTKVIKMVKSPKTGAYVFDEKMVPNDDVKAFFSKLYTHENILPLGSIPYEAGRYRLASFFVTTQVVLECETTCGPSVCGIYFNTNLPNLTNRAGLTSN